MQHQPNSRCIMVTIPRPEYTTVPNVLCKLSDLPVGANWSNWTEADLRPYIDTASDVFGFSAPYVRSSGDISMADSRMLYGDNANRLFSIGPLTGEARTLVQIPPIPGLVHFHPRFPSLSTASHARHRPHS
jgi:hypothetical protein